MLLSGRLVSGDTAGTSRNTLKPASRSAAYRSAWANGLPGNTCQAGRSSCATVARARPSAASGSARASAWMRSAMHSPRSRIPNGAEAARGDGRHAQAQPRPLRGAARIERNRVLVGCDAGPGEHPSPPGSPSRPSDARSRSTMWVSVPPPTMPMPRSASAAARVRAFSNDTPAVVPELRAKGLARDTPPWRRGRSEWRLPWTPGNTAELKAPRRTRPSGTG